MLECCRQHSAFFRLLETQETAAVHPMPSGRPALGTTVLEDILLFQVVGNLNIS